MKLFICIIFLILFSLSFSFKFSSSNLLYILPKKTQSFLSDKLDEINWKDAETFSLERKNIKNQNQLPQSTIFLDLSSTSSPPLAQYLENDSKTIINSSPFLSSTSLSSEEDFASNLCHFHCSLPTSICSTTSLKYLHSYYLDTLSSSSSSPSPSNSNSNFLSLTCNSLYDLANKLPTILNENCSPDALEIRVDFLTSLSLASLREQITWLRILTSSILSKNKEKICHLPLIFTVRSLQEGGKCKIVSSTLEEEDEIDTSTPSLTLNNLYKTGMKCGVEFVDLEVTLEKKMRQDMMNLIEKYQFIDEERKNPSLKIINSLHLQEQEEDLSEEKLTKYWEMTSSLTTPSPLSNSSYFYNPEEIKTIIKRGIIPKLVITPKNEKESILLHDSIRKIHEKILKITPSVEKLPYIGLTMGKFNLLGRILNNFFTAVTHPLLPIPAAKGQLSYKEIEEYSTKLKKLLTSNLNSTIINNENKEINMKSLYYLFGNSISRSHSPLIHNTAFNSANLSSTHEYFLHQTDSINEIIKKLKHDNSILRIEEDDQKKKKYILSCGGGSVTIPFKEEILPYIDVIGQAAKTIGAVNTVVTKFDEEDQRIKLYGYNTDWLGMYLPIKKLLEQEKNEENEENGENKLEEEKIGIILGGGGTSRAAAYALYKLGYEPWIFNRNSTKAREIAQQ